VHDATVERVVVRGNGPAFCSGGDLRDFGTSTDLVRAHAVRTTRHPGALLHALADRVEVQVHGACVGAGVELPAFAGRVIARADTVFQLPEVAMGTIPGAGGTVSLPRRIGPQRTLLLALSGLPLTAGDALRWGLVDEVAES
jgi:enoyl-CoA hydratase/carnithine racemase